MRTIFRSTIALSIGCLSVGTPILAANLPAQSVTRDSRLRYTVVGSLVGAALAGGYYLISDRGERGGQCDPKGCALPYLTVSGALSGLFLARDVDAQRRSNLPRIGRLERMSLNAARLPSVPIALAVRDSLLVVLSDSGALIYAAEQTPRALRRRAPSLNGLHDVAFAPNADELLLAGRAALYRIGLTSGVATRTLNGDITALAAGRTQWLAARGRRVTVETLRDGVLQRDSIEIDAAAISATLDTISGNWLIGTDSALIRIEARSGALAQTGKWPSTGPIRAIAVGANWIAAAEGDAGVTAWRRESLSSGIISPLRLAGEPRFAYDVSFRGNELFVAGGTDGLFRVALDQSATIVSVSKDLPFITIVRVGADGALWIADRARPSLVRAQTTMPPR